MTQRKGGSGNRDAQVETLATKADILESHGWIGWRSPRKKGTQPLDKINEFSPKTSPLVSGKRWENTWGDPLFILENFFFLIDNDCFHHYHRGYRRSLVACTAGMLVGELETLSDFVAVERLPPAQVVAFPDPSHSYHLPRVAIA